MGLSASQARLLSITARKSDCDFQSIQLSHEKLSISRDLALLSNQYQASLNQTKLMYDYYGTGTSMEQMNYNTLMSPSSLNDFRPITMTNSLNRVILDSRLASAAREAGIPQEGLGCSPSSDVRNKFAEGLMSAGVIDASVYNSIISTPYNQLAGLGSDGASFENTVTYTMDDIKELFLGRDGYKLGANPEDGGISRFTGVSGSDPDCGDFFEKDFSSAKKGDPDRLILQSFSSNIGEKVGTDAIKDLKDGQSPLMNASIYELLNLDGSEQQYYLTSTAIRGALTPLSSIGAMQHLLLDQGGILDWIEKEFTNTVGFNDKCMAAISTAKEEIMDLLTGGDGVPSKLMQYYTDEGLAASSDGVYPSLSTGKDTDESLQYGRVGAIYADPIGTYMGSYMPRSGDRGIARFKSSQGNAFSGTSYMGFMFYADNKGGCEDDGKKKRYAGININNVVKAFFTEFANCMLGYENGKTYEIEKGPIEGSKLATDDENFSFDVTSLVEMDGSNSRVVAFYDTLLNQIANDGWAENNEVQDPEYLQEMIQNGMMFITNMSDDGFYYQRNYQTFSYVKEVSDESEIAKAEADYRANKEKLNMKEQKLDLKMKNLDTEISSLTTEYDTVKNVISKNIEKGFKRYSA